jgi:hypothetical protein
MIRNTDYYDIERGKKLSGMGYPSLKVYLLNYLPAGFSGAGAGAGCSGAGAGASAGFSGAGVSAGGSAFLQPTLSEKDTSSNSDKSITKTFFINCHLLSLNISKNLKSPL